MADLDPAAALARLKVVDYDPGDGPGPCVHSFASPGSGVLLGAHWHLDDVRAAFEAHGVEEAGPNMAALGHGLVVTGLPDRGPIFFETNDQPKGPDGN